MSLNLETGAAEFWPAVNNAKGETNDSSVSSLTDGNTMSWDALVEGG